ncbi:MAG: iron-containing alcohol dehydrogenase [Magnetospirillum sp.]
MSTITFRTAPRIISRIGGLADLGTIMAELGVRRPLIVTDPGIVKCGIAAKATASLKSAGLDPILYDSVQADPPIAMVKEAAAFARGNQADGIVGLGGGSSLDTAKVVALMGKCTQPIENLFGIDMTRDPRLPLVQVPTTAGTGSEVTWVSVITNDANEKKVIYTPQLLPDVALLDAELTVGMPPKVTAATALDAMVHAIEGYTSRTKKNTIADSFARKALELLVTNLPKVLADGQNLAARAAMLEGAMLGGIAFVNSSVAAIHGLAYPLGARFHVPHGHSNALVMGPVLRFNLVAAEKLYAELAPCVLPGRSFASSAEAALAFVETLEAMAGAGGLETRLSDLGITDADIAPMAEEVVTQIQRLIAPNPRDMSFDDVCALYRAIL